MAQRWRKNGVHQARHSESLFRFSAREYLVYAITPRHTDRITPHHTTTQHTDRTRPHPTAPDRTKPHHSASHTHTTPHITPHITPQISYLARGVSRTGARITSIRRECASRVQSRCGGDAKIPRTAVQDVWHSIQYKLQASTTLDYP